MDKCGFLLGKIAQILGNNLNTLPCPATSAQMAYELGVMANLQLVEFMLSQKSLCLSWDATTINGTHVNEIHVTANKQDVLTINVMQIAGGKASDYVSHITGALCDAASTYAQFACKSEDEVFQAIKSSVTSSLTDRAPVNNVVTRQLCNEFEMQLISLHCNIHPLDSVARQIKSDLSKFDSRHGLRGNCFGKEGCAANLIKAVSTLRYKDGKGDPMGFKNFLQCHGLSFGTFPRYVGNRLHILFHLAGLLILHHSKLIDYLEHQCTAAGLLRSGILKDLKNNTIMVQVWALGVIGKIFSGPWMTKFYSSTMSNLEMGSLVKSSVAQLERWHECPADLLQPTQTAFLEMLNANSDEVVSAIVLFDIVEVDLQTQLLQLTIRSTLSVLRRQLNDFIEGPFSQPSSQIMALTASSPTNNMASERALGAFDRLFRRAPNATMGFLDGKVRCKMNKTMEWFERKDNREREDVVRFIVKEGQSQRARQTLYRRRISEEIAQRRRDGAIQKDTKRRNALIRELNKVFNKKKGIEFECSIEALTHVNNFCRNPDSVVGALIVYTESDSYGRVQQVKKNKKLVVSYWHLEEPESSSIDMTVSASSFFSDVVLGRVLFL